MEVGMIHSGSPLDQHGLPINNL